MNHRELRNMDKWRLFQQLNKRYLRYSLRNKTAYCVSGRRGQNCRYGDTYQNYKAKSGYITIGYYIG